MAMLLWYWFLLTIQIKRYEELIIDLHHLFYGRIISL